MCDILTLLLLYFYSDIQNVSYKDLVQPDAIYLGDCNVVTSILNHFLLLKETILDILFEILPMSTANIVIISIKIQRKLKGPLLRQRDTAI